MGGGRYFFKEMGYLNKNPQCWKLQFICQILKPGKDKMDPASYRLISLTSVC